MITEFDIVDHPLTIEKPKGKIQNGQSRDTGTRPGQTNKAKNIAQYVLDITIHKTQDEDRQIKKHNM